MLRYLRKLKVLMASPQVLNTNLGGPFRGSFYGGDYARNLKAGT